MSVFPEDLVEGQMISSECEHEHLMDWDHGLNKMGKVS